MEMNIASLSIGMHQAALNDSVSISLLKMTMNTVDNNAEQINKMMENMAVNPDKGINLDTFV